MATRQKIDPAVATRSTPAYSATDDLLVATISASGVEPYMPVAQAAAFLGVSPKRLRNMMYDGTLRRGEHWFAPPGLGPRLKRAALVAWIEGDTHEVNDTSDGLAFGPDVPRGRRRGGSTA